jgi:hypothetical protein
MENTPPETPQLTAIHERNITAYLASRTDLTQEDEFAVGELIPEVGSNTPYRAPIYSVLRTDDDMTFKPTAVYARFNSLEVGGRNYELYDDPASVSIAKVQLLTSCHPDIKLEVLMPRKPLSPVALRVTGIANNGINVNVVDEVRNKNCDIVSLIQHILLLTDTK